MYVGLCRDSCTMFVLLMSLAECGVYDSDVESESSTCLLALGDDSYSNKIIIDKIMLSFCIHHCSP